jgi:hypothetical protein
MLCCIHSHCCFNCEVASEKTSVNDITHLIIIIVEMLIIGFELSFKNGQEP